jgi:ribosome-associated protein
VTQLVEDDETGEEGEWGWVSRSERKRRAEALQDAGVRLMQVRPAQLKPLQLPPQLVAAIDEARRLSHGPALARQRKYIGRLMRELEPAEAERVLAAVDTFRDAKLLR